MLLDRLTSDLQAATKARDETRKMVLRWVLAQAKNLRIEKREELDDDDLLAIMKRGVKMRVEAVELYRKGGREDLEEVESREIEILRGYLPEQLAGEALRRVVEQAVATTGASSMREFGQVMQEVMREHGSLVDGKEVQALVKECLSG